MPRKYCAGCAPTAEAHTKAVSEAHTGCAEEWRATLASISEDYIKLYALDPSPDCNAK
jgi:hypothetical protein